MSTTPTIAPHHAHGRRLKNFLLPDGRKVLIAANPEEAESIRQRMAQVGKDKDFDIHIHGSAEHINALRTAHGHHENRRSSLKQQHGPVYDEFEEVRREMDILAAELHLLTEHGVNLDANFSKFGYSAHLRTKNDPDSSANSLYGESVSDKTDWEAMRRKGNSIKFWKRPVVRQYFHKGLLWRAAEGEEVASFELFVDLLYVGIIAINGDRAAEHPNASNLLKFCITFILSWKLWSDLTLIISWFESDDIMQRICVLFDAACLFGFTTNLVASFDTTYSQLIAFYLAARLFSGFYYIILAYLVPIVKGILVCNAISVLIPSVIWIGSVYVDEPQRLALIWVALFLDIFGAMFTIIFHRVVPKFSARLAAISERVFDFYPAVNIEHKTERTNAFVTLVFGYSVVALLYQNQDPLGINAFFGKAILGLVQAFAFNWIYFEVDGTNHFVHAIRRHFFSSIAWNILHLPFIMSFVLSAAALSKLVVAHDCSNADPDSLTDFYKSRSEEELTSGIRWFYCTGLGIALLCMGLISLTHVHKKIPGARLSKRVRIGVRFAVAVVLICLPLAQDLNSLQLIGTTTALVVLTLMVDLVGAACVDESFFGEKTQCKYFTSTTVRKKDLEHAVKTGETVNVQELAGREKGEKGFYELS
ncbi:MAG: hypothetical protein M1829_003601 [Trizodia sp. TS-e1964]|nr:MAG: hypothetical protein M1829_003601 [Trizodia sp. TS-e1964]